MRLSLMSWDKNVALDLSQEKIQGCGPWWVVWRWLSKAGEHPQVKFLNEEGSLWLGWMQGSPRQQQPPGVGFVHLEPFIHVPSQEIENQSKNNSFVFITPALK